MFSLGDQLPQVPARDPAVWIQQHNTDGGKDHGKVS